MESLRKSAPPIIAFAVILFLLVLAGLMYLVKRKVWANVPH